MIPANSITAWSATTPWPSRAQVEQDLLLCRLMIEIAQHAYLGDELVFRGGTCLHKLHLPRPWRYSEDLDYVRATSGGIKPLTQALGDLGRDLGFSVDTRISANPKVFLRGDSTDGIRLRIKIEVNTHERSPAQPLITLPYAITSPWWSGGADIRTFTAAELVATKIRALYQRKKGRDLFDLWLALTELQLDPDDILAAFAPYRPDRLTATTATANLAAKLDDSEFRTDLDLLVATWPPGYDIRTAADLISAQLHARL